MNYEIDITRRCNFKCPGCHHLCNIVSDSTSDMTLSDIESIVSQINANDSNPQRIIVMGGEPTLNPKCVEYCRYIKDHLRSYALLQLSTNCTDAAVVAEVESLGYYIADYLGSRDADELRRIKADVHYNALLSPQEEGLPIIDPHNCFVIRGIDGSGPCGMCVHKYRGSLTWCYCGSATSVCKLLQREGDFMFPTLSDLLHSSVDGLCREICVHCMNAAKHQVLAKDTPGRVSKCFAAGLAAFRAYGSGAAPSQPGAGRRSTTGGKASSGSHVRRNSRNAARQRKDGGVIDTAPASPAQPVSAEAPVPGASAKVSPCQARSEVRPGVASGFVQYAGPGRTCIVYATNGNSADVERLVWSLRSLVKRSCAAFDVVLLSNEPVSDPRVQTSCGTHSYSNVVDMYETLRSVGMFRDRWNRRWPFEVLYRLGIPLHPVFREYSRVLYLDTDVLTLSPKVDRLINADLCGFEAGGVYDIDGDCYARIDGILNVDLAKPQALEVLAHVGPSLFTRAYINAGVLLLNLDEIRRRMDWYRRRLGMFWEAECRCRFEYLDQDFVNAMMVVRTDFSTMFNWQRGGYPPDCVIRHYIKDQKEDMRKRAEEDQLV